MAKTSTSKFVEGIGRRKSATARVRIYPSKKGKDFVVNDLPLDEYFELKKNQDSARAPFEVVNKQFSVTALVKGSGKSAQAEAIRHGLSRALLGVDKSLRKDLKPRGFLTRDSRKKERKKPGLRSARRPQQWRKR